MCFRDSISLFKSIWIEREANPIHTKPGLSSTVHGIVLNFAGSKQLLSSVPKARSALKQITLADVQSGKKTKVGVDSKSVCCADGSLCFYSRSWILWWSPAGCPTPCRTGVLSIISVQTMRLPPQTSDQHCRAWPLQTPTRQLRPVDFRIWWKEESVKDLEFSRSLLPNSCVEDFYSILSVYIANTAPNSGCSDQIPINTMISSEWSILKSLIKSSRNSWAVTGESPKKWEELTT